MNMERRVTRTRSLLKTITFRVLATVMTMAFVFIFTGSAEITIGIGILEVVAKTVLYYVHERVWDKVGFGRLD